MSQTQGMRDKSFERFRNDFNVGEQLGLLVNWLGGQDKKLSQGLRHMGDAMQLYEYTLKRGDTLYRDTSQWHHASLKAAIGYNPFKEIWT